MRTTKLKSAALAAVLALVPFTYAQQQPAAQGQTIVVASAISELAEGYATACRQMSEARAVIFYRINGKVVSLKGIRAIKAFNGVLFITMSAGDSVAVNAESVIFITDGGRTP
jgi:hypothetical protein